MTVELELQNFITEKLLVEEQTVPLSPDENLLLNGMIDSLGIMQLVKYIEDNFGIEVAPGEVTLKNFKTINAMTTYIANKKAAVR